MLTVRQTQEIELEIMQKIHLYCQKWGLRYCMLYGTVLGAVRHKGFIPWDNDMDIGMPRPDFERLLQLVKEEPIGDDLYCVHYTTDEKYRYPVMRVCDARTKVTVPYIREQPKRLGVWVDIFVFDGAWERPWQHPIQEGKLKFFYTVLRGNIFNPDFSRKKWIAVGKRFIYKLFPEKGNEHTRKADYYAALCKYEDHNRVRDNNFSHPHYLTHEDFDDPVVMPFEKYTFLAPKNWEKHLKTIYGDFMTLPPEDKRVPHAIQVEWQ